MLNAPLRLFHNHPLHNFEGNFPIEDEMVINRFDWKVAEGQSQSGLIRIRFQPEFEGRIFSAYLPWLYQMEPGVS